MWAQHDNRVAVLCVGARTNLVSAVGSFHSLRSLMLQWTLDSCECTDVGR